MVADAAGVATRFPAAPAAELLPGRRARGCVHLPRAKALTCRSGKRLGRPTRLHQPLSPQLHLQGSGQGGAFGGRR